MSVTSHTDEDCLLLRKIGAKRVKGH